MIIFILMLLIILLITNNDIVLAGSTYGLMLWYENLLPLLLPFMLISGLIEKQIFKMCTTSGKNAKLAISSTLLLGMFCGYPIGAKTNAYFTQNKLINKQIGNLILPISNNVSPMFFLGFILSSTLKNNINPLPAYVALYIPYITFIILELLVLKPNTRYNQPKKAQSNIHNQENQSISQQSINQITMVGLYVMICSIITEFVLSTNIINHYLKLFIIGATEITRGVTYIYQVPLFDIKIKTALILGFTSFGGISSVMQTSKVIQGSGLSLLHYITVKLLCAICTFYLYLLLI